MSVLEKAFPKFAGDTFRLTFRLTNSPTSPDLDALFAPFAFSSVDTARVSNPPLSLATTIHVAMYRAALRSSPSALRAVRPTVSSGSRRLLSTASPKKGTWKGTGLRWGLAAGAVYFYNTSPIFADEVPRRFS